MSVNRWKLRHSVSALALVAAVAPASAQTVWTGAIDSNWFNAGNWQPAILPSGPTWINSNTPGAVISSGPAVSLMGTTIIGRDAGTNGSLTGYGGGIARKVKLLELERADMHGLFVPKKETAL